MITLEAVAKHYGKNKVLNNISLTLPSGKITGIVGANGAGKTTLFKCIAGLESHLGRIDYSKGSLRDTTGFLSTNPFFLSKITGAEYLKLMCNARNINIKDLNSQNIFNLPLHQYADSYSTGMKKKLALTAILLQKNDIFILDEPFNGVDIQSNILLKEVILKLKSLQKIVILSSHIFSSLTEICDQLHYLNNGKIEFSAGKNEFHKIERIMASTNTNSKLEQLNLG